MENGFFLFKQKIITTLRTSKIYNDTKMKGTKVNKTRQRKMPTRLMAQQSASAHATERIKVNGGWGQDEISQLIKHLHLGKTISIPYKFYGSFQNILIVFMFKLFIAI